jgi:hypothetical protein
VEHSDVVNDEIQRPRPMARTLEAKVKAKDWTPKAKFKAWTPQRTRPEPSTSKTNHNFSHNVLGPR